MEIAFDIKSRVPTKVLDIQNDIDRLQRKKNDLPILYQEGVECLDNGNPQKAKNILSEVYRLDPDYETVGSHLRLAIAEVKLIEQEANSHQDLSSPPISKMFIKFNELKEDEALSQLGVEPTEWLLLRANHTQDEDEKLAYYERAIRLEPNNEPAQQERKKIISNKATKALLSGELEEGIKLCQLAGYSEEEIIAKRITALIEIADRITDSSSKLEIYQQILNLDPRQQQILERKNNVWMQEGIEATISGKLEEALHALSEALNSDRLARKYIVDTLWQSSQDTEVFEEKLYYYDRIIQFQPNYSEAIKARNSLLIQRAIQKLKSIDFNNALLLFQKTNLNNDRIKELAVSKLVQFAENTEDLENERLYYEQILKLDPNNFRANIQVYGLLKTTGIQANKNSTEYYQEKQNIIEKKLINNAIAYPKYYSKLISYFESSKFKKIGEELNQKIIKEKRKHRFKEFVTFLIKDKPKKPNPINDWFTLLISFAPLLLVCLGIILGFIPSPLTDTSKYTSITLVLTISWLVAVIASSLINRSLNKSSQSSETKDQIPSIYTDTVKSLKIFSPLFIHIIFFISIFVSSNIFNDANPAALTNGTLLIVIIIFLIIVSIISAFSTGSEFSGGIAIGIGLGIVLGAISALAFGLSLSFDNIRSIIEWVGNIGIGLLIYIFIVIAISLMNNIFKNKYLSNITYSPFVVYYIGSMIIGLPIFFYVLAMFEFNRKLIMILPNKNFLNIIYSVVMLITLLSLIWLLLN